VRWSRAVASTCGDRATCAPASVGTCPSPAVRGGRDRSDAEWSLVTASPGHLRGRQDRVPHRTERRRARAVEIGELPARQRRRDGVDPLCDDFGGLDYYEVDPADRSGTELDRYDEPGSVTVGISTDGEQTPVEWGIFTVTVTIDDGRVTITTYNHDREADRLWVPP
jgi:hypothetical protein